MDCATHRETMMEVLYGEASPEAMRVFSAHLAGCEPCRSEMEGLRGLRRQLSAWRLPEAGPVRTHRRRLPAAVPYLAWAASVVLAFGSAFALSGSEARYQDGQLTVRLGRAVPAAAPVDLTRMLADQEARHQQEIAALRASLSTPDSDARHQELLRQVQELIRDSEARQAGAVDQRLATFAERSAAQRRYDLARMSAGLSYLEGKTGRDVARTAELVGYVLQAKQR